MSRADRGARLGSHHRRAVAARGALLLAALLLLASLPACVSFSTFQSPEVLAAGETQVGAGLLLGVSLEGDESGVGELALLVRRGLRENMDAGFRIWGIPPYVGLYGDLRYQLVREPVLVSGALGASVFVFDEYTTVGMYPTLMVGSERVHAGLKWTQFLLSGDNIEETFGTGFPGAVLGASFGSSVIFSPEVNVYFGDEIAVLPGAALQFRF